ncbi:MAG: phosphopantetheine-binding protein [Fusicatenibacter saccharivorans]
MKKYEMIEIQTNIEKIYKEVFGIPDIAEDTNFFEIGGNSILAAKVVQKIKTCLGINLAIQDIFEYVTVNLLISYIAKIYNEKTKMEEERWSYVKKKYKLNTTNFLFLCNC